MGPSSNGEGGREIEEVNKAKSGQERDREDVEEMRNFK